MSWWDTMSACQALGNKKLLSVYDLVNDVDNTANSSQSVSHTAFSNKLCNVFKLNAFIWTTSFHNSGKPYHAGLCEGDVINDAEPSGYWHSYVLCR